MSYTSGTSDLNYPTDFERSATAGLVRHEHRLTIFSS